MHVFSFFRFFLFGVSSSITLPSLTPRNALSRTYDAAVEFFLYQCHMTHIMETFDAFVVDVDEARHDELVVDNFWEPNTNGEEEDKSLSEDLLLVNNSATHREGQYSELLYVTWVTWVPCVLAHPKPHTYRMPTCDVSVALRHPKLKWITCVAARANRA